MLSSPGSSFLGSVFLLWLALSFGAHFWDARLVWVRHAPAWATAPSYYSFRWRFGHHMRKKHSLLRPFFVVPGHTSLTRLQLVTTLTTQLLVALGTTVIW